MNVSGNVSLFSLFRNSKNRAGEGAMMARGRGALYSLRGRGPGRGGTGSGPWRPEILVGQKERFRKTPGGKRILRSLEKRIKGKPVEFEPHREVGSPKPRSEAEKRERRLAGVQQAKVKNLHKNKLRTLKTVLKVQRQEQAQMQKKLYEGDSWDSYGYYTVTMSSLLDALLEGKPVPVGPAPVAHGPTRHET